MYSYMQVDMGLLKIIQACSTRIHSTCIDVLCQCLSVSFLHLLLYLYC